MVSQVAIAPVVCAELATDSAVQVYAEQGRDGDGLVVAVANHLLLQSNPSSRQAIALPLNPDALTNLRSLLLAFVPPLVSLISVVFVPQVTSQRR